MRVLHVIPSLSPTQGGPSYAMPLIARALVKQGIEVTVATTNDDGRDHVTAVPLGRPIPHDGYEEIYFPKQTEFYKFSWPLFRWLQTHTPGYDLVHIHALFSFSSVAAAYAAKMAKVHYLIRPLGVLNTWGFKNRRRLLKAASFKLLEEPILKHAAAMHYTSDAERAEAEKAGAVAQAEVIPLGLDLESLGQPSDPAVFHQAFPASQGKTLILFLSRVDEKKGLTLLMEAYAQLDQKGSSVLVIAGDGPDDYIAQLKTQAVELGISEHVLWTGHLEGEIKRSAFAAATVFVLPSYSENFGIAAVEAIGSGTPTILTPGVAIASDFSRNGGCIIAEPDAKSLSSAITDLLDNPARATEMSRRGVTWAREHYSISAMGEKLLTCYRTLLQA